MNKSQWSVYSDSQLLSHFWTPFLLTAGTSSVSARTRTHRVAEALYLIRDTGGVQRCSYIGMSKSSYVDQMQYDPILSCSATTYGDVEEGIFLSSFETRPFPTICSKPYWGASSEGTGEFSSSNPCMNAKLPERQSRLPCPGHFWLLAPTTPHLGGLPSEHPSRTTSPTICHPAVTMATAAAIHTGSGITMTPMATSPMTWCRAG